MRAGDTETDRVAKQVAGEIDSPPRTSAAGYARKALETNLASATGNDVLAALSTGGIDCLLGSRVNGTTLVWRPSWAQVQPGELPCTGEAAPDRQGTTPPH
ncbi:hypothetical protein AB0F52_30410 [Amycolatopsis sp. NPDC024027]|uniref:hypothetical protein n=1 Tax=Amycolatopsis sp. NPDC024027 TaxID=3154327 RepID=UPI003407869C